MPTLTTTACDLYLFRRDAYGRVLFLLLRPPAAGRNAEMWQILTGTAQDGETQINAALRTVRDVTGLEVINLWALDAVHSFYDPQEDRLHVHPVFGVEVAGGMVDLQPEYAEVRWITADQASALLRRSGHRDGLAQVNESIVLSDDRGAPFRVTSHG